METLSYCQLMERMLAAEARVVELAAENVALKSFGDKLNDIHNALNGEGTGIQGRAEVACQQVALEAAMEEFDAIETPATDSVVSGIKAEGAEACVRALVTADEADDFVDAPNICAEVARLLRESTK